MDYKYFLVTAILICNVVNGFSQKHEDVFGLRIGTATSFYGRGDFFSQSLENGVYLKMNKYFKSTLNLSYGAGIQNY